MIGENATNVTASLRASNRAAATALSRLAAGVKSSFATLPADLIAVENLRAAMAAMDAKIGNAERVSAVAATAEGAMGEVSALLRKAEGLVVANANEGGLTDAEREANRAELAAVFDSIDRIGATTAFAGMNLLDGSTSLSVAGERLSLPHVSTARMGETIVDGRTYTLDDLVDGDLDVVDGDLSGAQAVIRAAVADAATAQGEVGAFRANLVDSTRESFGAVLGAMSASVSRINDTDYASETAERLRQDVLSQVSLTGLQLMLHTSSTILSLFAGVEED